MTFLCVQIVKTQMLTHIRVKLVRFICMNERRVFCHSSSMAIEIVRFSECDPSSSCWQCKMKVTLLNGTIRHFSIVYFLSNVFIQKYFHNMIPFGSINVCALSPLHSNAMDAMRHCAILNVS